MDSPERESLILSQFHKARFDRGAPCFSHTPHPPVSDVGSSISRRLGSQPPMSVYDPYAYRSYPRQYPAYGVPTAQSYYSHSPSAYSYSPSAAYSYAPSAAYTSYPDSSRAYSGMGLGNMYFSLNGKLIRSYKIRSFRVSSSFGACQRPSPSSLTLALDDLLRMGPRGPRNTPWICSRKSYKASRPPASSSM